MMSSDSTFKFAPTDPVSVERGLTAGTKRASHRPARREAAGGAKRESGGGARPSGQSINHRRGVGGDQGKINILDRERLEELACECYQYVRNEYDRLLA
jgi:hypothetical protein